MSAIYSFVQKYLFWLVIGAIGLGLAFTKLSGGYEFTATICLAAALIMIYPSLVPLDFSQLKKIYQHKWLILLSLVLNFLILPALALLIGWLFLSQEPSLWLGLIILAILPGGGMVTTWAYKSKADLPLTVNIVIVNLIAAIFLVPIYLAAAINKLMVAVPIVKPVEQSCILESVTKNTTSCFLGGPGSISPLQIAVPILVIIVIPLVLAYATQLYLKKYRQEKIENIKKQFAAFSNIGLLAVLLILMGLKQNQIVFNRPDLVLETIAPLLIFYALNLGITWLLYRWRPDAVGKALAWGTYLRYITLALGLAISLIYQNPDYSLAVVVVVLAYLIQIPSSVWLANRFDKV
jgi:ACR3 family arsenite efflux pump ArsB